MSDNNSIVKNKNVCSYNVSTVLSGNILGLLGEYCGVITNVTFLGINKKFKKVIQKNPILCDFLNERKKLSNFEQFSEIFGYRKAKTSYLVELRNTLKKYTYFQINDFLSEIMKILFKQLTKNGELNLCNNFLSRDPECLKTLFEELEENMTITTLNISENSFGKNIQLMNYLSVLIKQNKTITTLNLSNNTLGEIDFLESLKILSSALKENKSIITINLEKNSLGDNPESMHNLLEGLKGNTCITEIILASNSLYNPKSMKILLEGLKDTPSITKINLASNNLGNNPESIQILLEGIQENSYITELNLACNYLGTEYEILKILIEGLKHNKSLTSLNLRNNSLENNNENTKDLIEELRKNKTITTLIIEDNPLLDNYSNGPRLNTNFFNMFYPY